MKVIGTANSMSEHDVLQKASRLMEKTIHKHAISLPMAVRDDTDEAIMIFIHYVASLALDDMKEV